MSDAAILLLAILLLANPPRAPATTMPAPSGGDGAITGETSLQPAVPAPNLESSSELIYFAPEIDVNYTQAFDFDPGSTAEPLVTADVAQLALLAAATNLSFGGRDTRIQDISKLDLATNGLGSTALVKRVRSPSSGGVDFGILRVFLLILVTVLVAFVVFSLKLT